MSLQGRKISIEILFTIIGSKTGDESKKKLDIEKNVLKRENQKRKLKKGMLVGSGHLVTTRIRNFWVLKLKLPNHYRFAYASKF